MAIRYIRLMGDRVLNKKSRPVEEMTPKLRVLIQDMFDTKIGRASCREIVSAVV